MDHLPKCRMFCLFLLLSVRVSEPFTVRWDSPLPQYVKYGRSLVLVGGNLQEDNAEIYNTIVEMAGGKGVARVGIINAASLDPVGGYVYYRDLFLHYGAARADRIPVDLNHTAASSDPRVVSLVHNQTGIFFGGGDPQRIIDTLVYANGTESPVLAALLELYRRGAVIAGTSAGIECLSSAIMVRGGRSYEALRYRAHPDVNEVFPDNLAYNADGGLGFFQGYFIDAHFSQKGREGRLIRLLLDTKTLPEVGVSRGFGVDENTALVVTHAGTAKEKGWVIGQHGVFFADVSRTIMDMYARDYPLRGIYAHYLTHGDEIELRRRNIRFSSTKQPMKSHEKYDHAFSSDDIFGMTSEQPVTKPQFVRVASSLFDARHDYSTYGDTGEANPRYRVVLSRSHVEVEGWVERKGSIDTDIVSYKNMYIEIHETWT